MRTPARPLRDPKTMLQEWAQARGLPTPAYREVERTGPHHDPEFRVAVDVADREPAEGHRPLQARRRAGRRRRDAARAKASMAERAMAERRGSRHSQATRCGFIALIGAPNAGKSTLINALVGAKVTIVSHKVQTTRALVRGIAIGATRSSCLIDTPAFSRRGAGSTAPW